MATPNHTGSGVKLENTGGDWVGRPTIMIPSMMCTFLFSSWVVEIKKKRLTIAIGLENLLYAPLLQPVARMNEYVFLYYREKSIFENSRC